MRFRLGRCLALVFPVFLLFSCATDLPHIPIVPEGFKIPSDFRVVGYFPSWSGDPESIQYRALTHICYAFAAPAMDGDILPVDNENKLYRLMYLGHTQGVKILLSFGSWTDASIKAYETIAADTKLTDFFVSRVLDIISRYNLDGIDIDWEFPTKASSSDYANFIGAIARALHGQGKIVTMAVSADNVHGQYFLDSAIADVDFVDIMAYDDGLEEPPGKNHSSYWFASSSLDYWLNDRSLPRTKAVLGVPFYGRSLVDRHSISYYRIHKRDFASSATDSSGGFGYNGFNTIKAKSVNLGRYRCSGIMIWQLNQDANGADSLLNAIFDVIKEPAK